MIEHLTPRRQFLKALGLGIVAATAPDIFIPSTRTIVDLNPKSLPVWSAGEGTVMMWTRVLSADDMRCIATQRVVFGDGIRFIKHFRWSNSIWEPLRTRVYCTVLAVESGIQSITIVDHPYD